MNSFKQMRASVLVLGHWWRVSGQAASFRCRAAAPSAFAPSPSISKDLRSSAACISFNHGLRGCPRQAACAETDFYFDTISVTGTENLMMAATSPRGLRSSKTLRVNPEVQGPG